MRDTIRLTGHRRAGEIREAFATLLLEWPWQWFVTWTFAEPIRPEPALRAIQSHLWLMSRWGAKAPLGWLAGLETPYGADRPHGHGLLSGGEDLHLEPLAHLWRHQHGGFRFERPRSQERVTLYCAKVSRKDSTLLISDNIAGFRRPPPPA